MRAALMAALVIGSAGGALAEGVVIYTDRPYYTDEEVEGAARVHRYRPDEDRPLIAIPVRPADCGVYHYWNGERCVDARVVPPDLR
jgi:hypothetical protein